MEWNPLTRLSMAAIVSIVLIATGCTDESASTAVSAPAPEPTPKAQSPSVPTGSDQPVAGQIRDSQFIVEQAILSPGTLELWQGSEFFADLAAKNQTDLQGSGFATFGDIKVLKGELLTTTP